MKFQSKFLIWCVASLSAAASFGATVDARVADAAEHNNKSEVESMLKLRADVNGAQPDGATALIWAAHWNQLEIADLLIAAKANANAISEYGATPLFEACINGSAEMVGKLLKAGANANTALPGTGETVLMRCARTGNPDAVKALLAAGANANAVEPARGQTALMWALEERHDEAARVLVESGADVHAKSKGGFSPLLFAARQGDVEAAQLLLAKGADPNEAAPGGLNALLVGIDSMHEDFAIFLVEHGANPNTPDRDGLAPLHYALRKGFSYLKAGQRDDHYGQIGVPYLFRENMTKLVASLLEHGANPNARITRGGRRNQMHQSDFVKVSIAGATPFILAAASGDLGSMKLLLAKGADPKVTTSGGLTALMAAAGVGLGDDRLPSEAEGALAAAKMLVDIGLDVNQVSTDCGWTALHGAAYIGANDMVKFLVSKGAKLNVKDEMGQTPLTIAEGDPNWLSDDHDRKRHGSTVALIRELGGDPLQTQGTASVGGVATYPLTSVKY